MEKNGNSSNADEPAKVKVHTFTGKSLDKLKREIPGYGRLYYKVKRAHRLNDRDELLCSCFAIKEKIWLPVEKAARLEQMNPFIQGPVSKFFETQIEQNMDVDLVFSDEEEELVEQSPEASSALQNGLGSEAGVSELSMNLDLIQNLPFSPEKDLEKEVLDLNQSSSSIPMPVDQVNEAEGSEDVPGYSGGRHANMLPFEEKNAEPNVEIASEIVETPQEEDDTTIVEAEPPSEVLSLTKEVELEDLLVNQGEDKHSDSADRLLGIQSEDLAAVEPEKSMETPSSSSSTSSTTSSSDESRSPSNEVEQEKLQIHLPPTTTSEETVENQVEKPLTEPEADVEEPVDLEAHVEAKNDVVEEPTEPQEHEQDEKLEKIDVLDELIENLVEAGETDGQEEHIEQEEALENLNVPQEVQIEANKAIDELLSDIIPHEEDNDEESQEISALPVEETLEAPITSPRRSPRKAASESYEPLYYSSKRRAKTASKSPSKKGQVIEEVQIPVIDSEEAREPVELVEEAVDDQTKHVEVDELEVPEEKLEDMEVQGESQETEGQIEVVEESKGPEEEDKAQEVEVQVEEAEKTEEELVEEPKEEVQREDIEEETVQEDEIEAHVQEEEPELVEVEVQGLEDQEKSQNVPSEPQMEDAEPQKDEVEVPQDVPEGYSQDFDVPEEPTPPKKPQNDLSKSKLGRLWFGNERFTTLSPTRSAPEEENQSQEEVEKIEQKSEPALSRRASKSPTKTMSKSPSRKRKASKELLGPEFSRSTRSKTRSEASSGKVESIFGPETASEKSQEVETEEERPVEGEVGVEVAQEEPKGHDVSIEETQKDKIEEETAVEDGMEVEEGPEEPKESEGIVEEPKDVEEEEMEATTTSEEPKEPEIPVEKTSDEVQEPQLDVEKAVEEEMEPQEASEEQKEAEMTPEVAQDAKIEESKALEEEVEEEMPSEEVKEPEVGLEKASEDVEEPKEASETVQEPESSSERAQELDSTAKEVVKPEEKLETAPLVEAKPSEEPKLEPQLPLPTENPLVEEPDTSQDRLEPDSQLADVSFQSQDDLFVQPRLILKPPAKRGGRAGVGRGKYSRAPYHEGPNRKSARLSSYSSDTSLASTSQKPTPRGRGMLKKKRGRPKLKLPNRPHISPDTKQRGRLRLVKDEDGRWIEATDTEEDRQTPRIEEFKGKKRGTVQPSTSKFIKVPQAIGLSKVVYGQLKPGPAKRGRGGKTPSQTSLKANKSLALPIQPIESFDLPVKEDEPATQAFASPSQPQSSQDTTQSSQNQSIVSSPSTPKKNKGGRPRKYPLPQTASPMTDSQGSSRSFREMEPGPSVISEKAGNQSQNLPGPSGMESEGNRTNDELSSPPRKIKKLQAKNPKWANLSTKIAEKSSPAAPYTPQPETSMYSEDSSSSLPSSPYLSRCRSKKYLPGDQPYKLARPYVKKADKLKAEKAKKKASKKGK